MHSMRCAADDILSLGMSEGNAAHRIFTWQVARTYFSTVSQSNLILSIDVSLNSLLSGVMQASYWKTSPAHMGSPPLMALMLAKTKFIMVLRQY